jgi:predicted Zn-dependent protease
MEKQADLLGTKLLAASGYAADGLRNLTVTLQDQNEPSPPTLLSTHPNISDRVKYLENLIATNHYNRYNYEGVARHLQIQAKVRQLMKEYQNSDDYRIHHSKEKNQELEIENR